MNKCIAFAIGNLNYLDPIRIALGTYVKYNDTKLRVYITDNSADTFKELFNTYENIEFVNIDKSKSREYFDAHYNEFVDNVYGFSKDHIFDVFVANELLDQMIKEFKGEYQVILRLDLDVIFLSSIENSIDNFIYSKCRVGSSIESNLRNMISNSISESGIKLPDNYMNAGNFMIRLDDDTITDHFERTIELQNSIGLHKFKYPDQDALNLIYRDSTIYNANSDGWILSVVPASNYINVEYPIFLHFASKKKPFVKTVPVEHIHELYYAYPMYLEAAKEYNCSDTFIDTIASNIELIKAYNTTMTGKLFIDVLERRKMLRKFGVI